MSTTVPFGVRRYLERCQGAFYDDGVSIAEAIVAGTFDLLAGSLDVARVQVKVHVLNRRYSLQLGRNQPDERDVVRHVVSLGRDGLDSLLAQGHFGAVDRLAHLGGSNRFSFATKYAHFSSRTKFPLWDDYADRALKHLNVRFGFYTGHTDFQWTPAENWVTAVNKFRRFMASGLSFRDADHILWVFGYILAKGRSARAYTNYTGPRPEELW